MGRTTTLRASSIATLALVAACGRTGLKLDEIDRGGGSGASGANASGGFGGSVPKGGSTGSTVNSCPSGALTWSCAASVPTGPCCDPGGGLADCETCPLEGNPQGEACDKPGQSIAAPVLQTFSRACEIPFFSCWVSACTCGCRDDPWEGISGLAETCEPLVFSNAHDFPLTIAVDGEFVYWTVYGDCPLSPPDSSTGRLVRANRVNGSQTVDIDGLPCPRGVAVAGDDVYITNNPGAIGGSLWTARTNGENVRVLVEGLYSPTTVHADTTHVYFADDDKVRRVAREGSGQPELVTTAESVNSNTVNAFVLDEQYVYWIDEGRLADDGTIRRSPKAGGFPDIVAAAEKPLEIAISDAGLFWVDEIHFERYAIVFLPWGAAAPIEIATTVARPSSLAAVADEAYWVENAEYRVGTVRGVSARTLEPIFFEPTESTVSSVIVDDDYVFWTTFEAPEEIGNNGHVFRACRPDAP